MELKKIISPKPEPAIKIEVAAYDPLLKKEYEKEAANLKKIFRGELLEIQPIGSTSIPGMPAKPIIDMLLVVKSIQKIDRFNKKMQRLGYIPKGENGSPGRRFFIKGDELHHTCLGGITGIARDLHPKQGRRLKKPLFPSPQRDFWKKVWGSLFSFIK